MARPSTTARIAAFHTGVFDTIGFLTAWSPCLRQSLLRARFVDPFGRRSLPGRKNSLKALLPRAPETVPPQSAPAEPETHKKAGLRQSRKSPRPLGRRGCGAV